MNATGWTEGMKTANDLYRAQRYRDALALYEKMAEDPMWKGLVNANIQLCRNRLEEKHPGGSGFPEIVVTLTTIDSRLHLLPKVIESLKKQSLPASKIELNISREPYLLDKGIAPEHPILQTLSSVDGLNVNWVPNTGPYRKLWLFLQRHFSGAHKHEKFFVTVDDDTLYPEYFLQRLYETYLEHDCIVAFRGRHMEVDDAGLSAYDKWTWGRTEPTLNNLPTGKDGIFYSTRFFTPEFLDLATAQRLAPTADDLWIKWHCALNGVPAIVLNPEACSSDYKSFPVVDYDKSYRSNSLYAHHNASGASNKNNIAVVQLEEYFQSAYGYNLLTLLSKPGVHSVADVSVAGGQQ